MPEKLDVSPDSPDGKLRVLSLDGGGFRGLGMLYVLDGITKAANARNRRPTDPQLKPHEIFDIIVGSSTGGLIAVLIGRLGLDCDQAIAEYKALATALFGTSRSAFMEKLLADQKFEAATVERYDAAVAALIAKYSSAPAFSTDPVTNAKTAVSIQPSGGGTPQLVPSFGLKPSSRSSWEIHDVIRATTAAPRYLAPYIPSSAPATGGFTDAAYTGQTINPTIIGKRYWNSNLGVLVNIGQWFPAVQLPTDEPLTLASAKEFNEIFLGGAPEDPEIKTEETVLTYLKQIETSKKVLNNVQKQHAGALERLDPPLAPQDRILELVDIFCEATIVAEVQKWISDNSARFTDIARKLVKEGVWDEPDPTILPPIPSTEDTKPAPAPETPDDPIDSGTPNPDANPPPSSETSDSVDSGTPTPDTKPPTSPETADSSDDTLPPNTKPPSPETPDSSDDTLPPDTKPPPSPEPTDSSDDTLPPDTKPSPPSETTDSSNDTLPPDTKPPPSPETPDSSDDTLPPDTKPPPSPETPDSVNDALPNPAKPPSDPAIPDPNPNVHPYNPVLDARKPREMLQYLSTYRVIFVIDDSSSMVMTNGHNNWDPQCARWRQAQNSIGPIANFAFQHKVSSIDIGFMHHQRNKPYRGIQSSQAILDIFRKAQPPQNWHRIQYTPTGSVLKFYIDEAIRELDLKVNDPEGYKKVRPTDIIVLTDGEADDNNHPKPVMVAARREMDRKKHNHNYLGIQFVQIGDSSLAKLSDLTEGEYGDMADLVLSDGTDLTSEKLTRVLLGGIHPTVRGRMHGGSSSPSHPVILIHGLTTIPTLNGSSKTVEKLLSDSGMETFTPSIPIIGGIEERSAAVINQIASRYPGASVHLFGHSIGGINARDLASKAMSSNLGFQILTVTTFVWRLINNAKILLTSFLQQGTPHLGMKMIINGPIRQLRALLGTDFGLFSRLTPDFMEDWNRKCRNNPSVKYFSWAGVSEIPPPVLLPFHAASRIFGPTDGMVNVSSATWDSNVLGPGVHLGTVAGHTQFSIINDDTASPTIPHLKLAQDGTTAPASVGSIDNTLLNAATRRVDGAVNTALAPGRALFGPLGF
ncbi:hypothetical protein MD484_g5883, partial [Candolleomyces efflorescens]